MTKDKNFKQINDYSLHLLQRIYYLLLGKIEPSFNVLRYASKVSVFNNGFERCLVLCLSLLGNLWSLLHEQHLSIMLSILKNNVSHLPSQIIKDNFPELFTNLQHIQEIKNSNDVFHILLSIQLHSQSYMVSLQYQYSTAVKGRLFSFIKIDPELFPTFAFRPSKNTSIVQNTKQRQQHTQQLQHHVRSNKPVVAQQPLTNQVQKSKKHKEVAVKQHSQQKVPNNSHTLPQTLDVNVTSETAFDETAANHFSNQLLSHTDSLNEEQIVEATLPSFSEEHADFAFMQW